MPGVDWIPIVSQLKSIVQLVSGDAEGAAATQRNFGQECPVVSQGVSLGQLVAGDAKGALETQKKCLGTVNNVANGIPVVGHAKGLVHYAFGDADGGNQAMNSATRTTVVMGSGAAAALATGGVAAIPAGIAAGVAYDGVATEVTGRPQGVIAAVQNIKDNPNAGNIFDAICMPIGDGLAGYSGGQIAKTVNNAVKVNNLKNARNAKYAALDEAMFGEVRGPDGVATALGAEINKLTAQIEYMQNGSPQFWWDPKQQKVVVTKGPNVTAAVPGYVSELSESNGIISDYYGGEECPGGYKSQQAKAQRLQYYSTQKPSANVRDSKAFQNVIQTTEMAYQRFKNNHDPKKVKEARAFFQAIGWLHVRMPSQFNYTGVIMINQLYQGLLHSLLRHGNEWIEMVPGLQELVQSIPTLQAEFNRIGAANPSNAGQLLNAFHTVRNAMSNGEIETLNDLQLEIYRFLCDNVTYANYLGEGVNERGLQQVYFEVRDRMGRSRVMAVCVSEELYSPVHGDPRPIRTITTIFFISMQDFKKRLIKKLF